MKKGEPRFIKSHTRAEKVANYWQEVMHSTHCKMSRGAEYVDKIITWAHADNWRRKNKKK